MIKPRTDIPDSILPSPPFRILPQPSDTWDLMGPDGVDTVDYHGDPKVAIGGLQAGQMVMILGVGKPQQLEVVTKQQHVALAPMVSPLAGRGGRRRGAWGPVYNANAGTIHVKFLAIDER